MRHTRDTNVHKLGGEAGHPAELLRTVDQAQLDQDLQFVVHCPDTHPDESRDLACREGPVVGRTAAIRARPVALIFRPLGLTGRKCLARPAPFKKTLVRSIL
jgi:hypothetical protein